MNESGTQEVHLNDRRLAKRKRFTLFLSAAVIISFAGLFLAPIASPLAAAQDAAAPSVSSETIHYDSGGFNIDAFVAKPAGAGKHPAVLVIHDSQGLNDSVRDIAKQFAAAGFFVFAPDFTSRLGGARTPGQMAQAVGQLSPNLTVQDARAGFAYLQKDPDVDAAKISTVGLGWGGWRSFMLAVSVPELYRAVVYCGSPPSQGLDAVHAPVLAHYAQYDFRTTGNALLTEKEMTEAGKKFTYFVYPQVNRGFYATGTQYDADAAKLAWTRTLDFLK
ncbi:MAG: dienelactone hydrolase family protein [Candidatus Acidiferrales bacterium]